MNLDDMIEQIKNLTEENERLKRKIDQLNGVIKYQDHALENATKKIIELRK